MIIREWKGFIILACNELDYKVKKDKISRGDVDGFYIKEDYYKSQLNNNDI